MRIEHLIYCGGVQPSKRAKSQCHHLRLYGSKPNVTLKIEDISKRLLTNLPDLYLDLLDIAMYVYAADSTVSRGTNTDARMGERWRRHLHLIIPVRNTLVWSSESVYRSLVETIGFLSDDDYRFEFRPLTQPPEREIYFEFGSSADTAFRPDEIILFSGGLDSFAGTVETLATTVKSVALVSHRSSSKIDNTQQNLVGELKARIGEDRVFHLPVRAHLYDSNGTRDYMHRSRSFLFAALGAVTAKLFGVNRINFFENGIMSLNLPPVEQVVGARATRTTHPKVIRGLNRLFGVLFDDTFEVSNPFIWKTRAEVVKRIVDHGLTEMIRHTVSCTRTRERTKVHPHCGLCWQCIDRRFSILAAGVEEADPADGYEVQLFDGIRSKGTDRETVLSYVRLATAIRQMPDVAFFERFGEANRVVDCFDEPAHVVGERIYEIYQRHAKAVCDTFDNALRRNVAVLREQGLSPDCLLMLAMAPSSVGEDDIAISHQTAFDELFRDTRVVISINPIDRTVTLGEWGQITGNSAKIFIVLAESFRKASSKELPVEFFEFIRSDKLARLLKIDEPALRQQISRCRSKISELALRAGVDPPKTDSIIENDAWRGYRLNPDHVRISVSDDRTDLPQ